MTPEQTISWLAGEGAPTSAYVDPELRGRMQRQQQKLQVAIGRGCDELYKAMLEDGAGTAERLKELTLAAPHDFEARRLLGVMISELIKTAWA